jgi:hypothetical protein
MGSKSMGLVAPHTGWSFQARRGSQEVQRLQVPLGAIPKGVLALSTGARTLAQGETSHKILGVLLRTGELVWSEVVELWSSVKEAEGCWGSSQATRIEPGQKPRRAPLKITASSGTGKAMHVS